MGNIKLSDGSVVTFEYSKTTSAFEAQTPLQGIETSLKKVTTIGGQVLKETAEFILKSVENMKPDELEIEIGLSLGYEGSIIISKGSAEANIGIKAVWKR